MTSAKIKKQEIVNKANMQNQNARFQQTFGIPNYFNTPQFKEFLQVNDACHNEGTGYMFIRLDKEDSFYRSGETVKGTLFFELFHNSVQSELFIKFEGLQQVPQHIKKKIITGEDDKDYETDPFDSSELMNSRSSRIEESMVSETPNSYRKVPKIHASHVEVSHDSDRAPMPQMDPTSQQFYPQN